MQFFPNNTLKGDQIQTFNIHEGQGMIFNVYSEVMFNTFKNFKS